MKKLILFIVALFFCAFLFSYAKGQSAFNAGSPAQPQPEPRSSRTWNMEWESGYQSSLETPNKTALIERSVITGKIRFANIKPKRTMWLATNAARATSRNHPDYYLGIAAGYESQFDRFALSADAEVGYTHGFNYGRAGGGIAKKVHKENYELKPFTRLDYYFPIDNFGSRRAHHTVSQGITWSTGMDTSIHSASLLVENRSQVIVDSGSLIPGQRTLLNTELMFGWRFRRICVGPKLDYTHRLSGPAGFHHKRNHLSGGFFVSYR